jgi:hypothetical protein
MIIVLIDLKDRVIVESNFIYILNFWIYFYLYNSV